MLNLAYDRCRPLGRGGFAVDGTSGTREPYSWHYWLPLLASAGAGLRPRPTAELLRRRVPFVYPLELRWEVVEFFAGAPEETELADEIPIGVLEAIRAGRAALLLGFGHEGRSLAWTDRDGRTRTLFDRVLDLVLRHDLPPSGLWLTWGNHRGEAEFAAWRRTRPEAAAAPPFQLRRCEPFSLLLASLLRLHENGLELAVDWRAAPWAGGLRHRSIRVRRRPARRPAREVFHYPEDVESWLTGDPRPRPHLVLCMNRAAREHRLAVVCHLLRCGLLDRALVSLGAEAVDETVFEDPGLEAARRALLPLLPLTIDHPHSPDPRHYARDNAESLFPGPSWPYRRTYFNVVTETLFDDGSCFVSEKIFKPILNMQPFLVAGSAGSLGLLRRLGFRTFSAAFDESYDLEARSVDRLQGIFRSLDLLARLDSDGAHQAYRSLLPVLGHNFQRFREFVPPFADVLDEIRAAIDG